VKKMFVRWALIGGLFSVSVNAADIDLNVITKIRDERFNHSQVMKTLSHLSDEIGPRLTGTPALLQANQWTKEKLLEWGLENAKLESFEFGRGWTMKRVEVAMVAPRRTQVYALPIAWLPGTEGVIESETIYAPMKEKKDFDQFKGKLTGKIVFVDEMPEKVEPSGKLFVRRDKENLDKMAEYIVPVESKDDSSKEKFLKIIDFSHELNTFLTAEGALALVRRPRKNGMLASGTDYHYLTAMKASLPGVSVAAEHYDRAVRLMNNEHSVVMSLDTDVTFHEEDNKAYSTIAEIPGKGRKPEVVMAGAHLDSWSAGDGTVDNGAGVAVVMEAVRILKAIGIKPKRTIRVGLWGGEEQGLLGSLQYVDKHLATRPSGVDERLKYLAPIAGKKYGGFPVKKASEFERFSVYFNLDHGSGKIRGIYAEENQAAAAIFKRWFEPFEDLGANSVVLSKTGQTDHVSFDQVGLSGFQFIQDPLDYFTRLHHTQLDLFSHAYEKDLKQASVILASFIYNAAMRSEKIPRGPFPKKPRDDQEIATNNTATPNTNEEEI
jgi:carboxypeptidase Q